MGLSPCPHEACLIALPVALGDRRALVLLLATFAQSKQNLGASTLVEVDLQRHQGYAFARYRAGECADLLARQQKFPRGARLEARQHPTLVFWDICVEQPHLAVALAGPGIR